MVYKTNGTDTYLHECLIREQLFNHIHEMYPNCTTWWWFVHVLGKDNQDGSTDEREKEYILSVT